MRTSLALSAIAGGLAIAWAGLASADAPPAAALPAAPIFYCPTPPAAPAATAPTTATPASHHHHAGPACPGPERVAEAHRHHVRHHQRTIAREVPREPPQGTGHMFWFRYQGAMNDIGPPCPNAGRGCPPPPPAGLGPPCPRAHHTCPPVGDGYAQMGPPPAPVWVRPPCPDVRYGCPPPRGDEALTSRLPPPPADLGPPCPRIHRTCPPAAGDDGGYALTPPPPPCPRIRHDCPPIAGADGAYAQNLPPPAPPGYVEREQRGGYVYERSQSEHSSGWSYSEENGRVRTEHWDDRNGGRPPPPRPPCPRDGCQADPPAYADGAGQWQDGSYGQVYPVAGRDANGYLVWPGKTPQ